MTQTAYENRTDAKHLPIGSVTIEDFYSWELYGTRYYQVTTCGEMFQYRTHPKHRGTLYTMDGDGNCKSPSVFREPLGVSV